MSDEALWCRQWPSPWYRNGDIAEERPNSGYAEEARRHGVDFWSRSGRLTVVTGKRRAEKAEGGRHSRRNCIRVVISICQRHSVLVAPGDLIVGSLDMDIHLSDRSMTMGSKMSSPRGASY